MKKPLNQTPRVRLDSENYRRLYREVLARDGWRCQSCGSMRQLQVHHMKFRSRSGGDEELNLITFVRRMSRPGTFKLSQESIYLRKSG
jgi:5-methylcytosine-specific restriction endonuclease McrA